ncbi:hypothetical protein OJ252_1872 [Cryptosporidium canis]|uniref:Uncharacterized protein n=1 Tax=Cryptosporidium canis TaxID=195482 RepID=A0ABQ8P6T6_9CRYT|nr:hypothetical protein OJ252_1872 [Cryptosporidium canis]
MNMPFQCCMGSKPQDSSIDNDNCTIKKVPKSIDLNDGYNTPLEYLIFKNTQKNSNLHGCNPTNNDLNKLSYHPVGYFNANPLTFVETKVSNLVNTPDGPTVTQASSNVILSGCNSPIKLITSIETPPGTNFLGNIHPPTVGTGEKEYQSHYISNANETKCSDSCCIKDDSIHDVHKISNFLDNSKVDDEEIVAESPKYLKSVQSTPNSQCMQNDKIDNECEFEQGIEQVQEYNSPGISTEIELDKMTDNKETCNISQIKNGIDELIVLSKLNNGDKYVEKRRKKTKKTIHIEISFSPKNNIFVDAQHNQNEKSTIKLNPLSNFGMELTNTNNSCPKKNEDLTEKNTYHGSYSNITEMHPDGSAKQKFETCCNTGVISGEVCHTKMKFQEHRTKSIDSEKKSTVENTTNNTYLSPNFDDINCYEKSLDTPNNTFEKNTNSGIKSFENLIPFIDEPKEKTENSDVKESEYYKSINKKESSFSLTYDAQRNDDAIELSQETLERLNGSLPIVESDPQMAQLFASAQVRIDDIDDQNRLINNDKSFEECDPIDLINKFLDNPSKYKDSICWATIKAVKEVYEPQVEYARKELDRWTNCEKSEESKDNIEYYSSLVSELQEKLILSEKARELLMTEYKYDDIQLVIKDEKKSLEEIKQRISEEGNALKSLEERYLNGCIDLKENVRVSRQRIKDLENELKSKLTEIHKLEDLLKIHENGKIP